MPAIRQRPGGRQDKYLFVFFWGRREQTNAMYSVFQSAMASSPTGPIGGDHVADPAEKPIVAKFGVDRSPLPLVLAIAPNGAITKGFPNSSTKTSFNRRL